MVNFMTKDKPNVKKIIPLMFAQTKAFILFCVTTLLLVFFEICSLILLKGFVDKVIVLKDYSRISYYVVPLLFIFILSFFVLLLHTKNKSEIIGNVSKELSENLYSSILYSEMNNFENTDYNRAVKKAMKNCEFVASEYIGKNVLVFIESLGLILGAIVISLINQPIFGLVILLLMPFFVTISKGLSIFVNRSNSNYYKAYGDNNQKVMDTFENIKNVKLLNGLKYEKEKFEELNKTYNKSLGQKNVSEVLNGNAICVLFIGVIYAIIIGIGGMLDQNGTTISAGTYVLYTLLTPITIALIYKMIHLKLKGTYVDLQVKDIQKIIDLRSELRSEPVDSFDELHTVKFKDVVIIEKKQEIINKISFELKKGEKLGIYCTDLKVKGLLFDLLTRLHRPDEGSISINNCDLTKIGPECLRSLIASIHHDSKIFSDTIINNICYPSNFDEYKYNDALYRSGLKSDVGNLPLKDHTLISKYDNNEFNRRVVYANAFYKDAKIYMINESSDGLDVALETEMINEVFKLKNKIVIIETDKPYLLSKCDKVLIIENGEQIEFGRYDELIKTKSSRFYKLIKSIGTKKSKIS